MDDAVELGLVVMHVPQPPGQLIATGTPKGTPLQVYWGIRVVPHSSGSFTPRHLGTAVVLWVVVSVVVAVAMHLPHNAGQRTEIFTLRIATSHCEYVNDLHEGGSRR